MNVCMKVAASAAIGFVMALGAAQSADANTIHDILIQDGEKAIDCSLPGCKGVLEDGALPGSEAFAFDKPGNANPTSITNLLNTILGTSFATGIRTNAEGDNDDEPDFNTTLMCDDDEGELCMFSSGAAFIGIKFGKKIAFVSNMTGGEVKLTFTKFSGKGGLSNITEIGTATVVPVPAPLALLLTAIGGLGLLGRRKGSQVAF